jgi:hypothetical protein
MDEEWVNSVLRKAVLNVEVYVQKCDAKLRMVAGPFCTQVRMNAIRAIATHNAGKTQELDHYTDVVNFIVDRFIQGHSMDECIEKAILEFWN